MSEHLADPYDVTSEASSSPDARTASLPSGTLIGAWVIEAEIGAGSMGKVYRARHQRLGRQVALKVLRDELLGSADLVERFLQEGRAVNQINHEHIVEVHDYLEDRDPRRVYCVMEYLQGQSLAQRLAQRASSIESIRSMARQMASALGASHAAGVVHRDLKPDNIFLVSRGDRDDWVKVLDFGVAKCVEPLNGMPLVQTVQGAVMGTPRYMAPEQVSGLDVDARTDIYALGNILYELIAGQPPFDGASFGQLAAAIIKDPLPPLPTHTASQEAVPADLAALIAACLAKSPEDRPGSMAVVEAALAARSPLLLLTPVRRGPRARGMGLLAAALALTLAFVVRPEPATAVVVRHDTVETPPVARPEEVTLWIETQPAGARVSLGDSGEQLGTTPLEVKLVRAPSTMPLRIELDGYAPLERQVSKESSQRLKLNLQALRKTATRTSGGLLSGVRDPY